VLLLSLIVSKAVIVVVVVVVYFCWCVLASAQFVALCVGAMKMPTVLTLGKPRAIRGTKFC
jgi:hypothetical protein